MSDIVNTDTLEEVKDTLPKIAAVIEWQEKLLCGRDYFIVEQGLWDAFTQWVSKRYDENISQNSCITKPILNECAKALWARRHGVKTNIDARWNIIKDDPACQWAFDDVQTILQTAIVAWKTK